jgi:hypothetical protein
MDIIETIGFIFLIIFMIGMTIILWGYSTYLNEKSKLEKLQNEQKIINQFEQWLKSWVGKSTNELSISVGVPTEIFNIDNNNKIWIYKISGQLPGFVNIISLNQHNNSNISFTPISFRPPTATALVQIRFYINRSGIIYASNYERYF